MVAVAAHPEVAVASVVVVVRQEAAVDSEVVAVAAAVDAVRHAVAEAHLAEEDAVGFVIDCYYLFCLHCTCPNLFVFKHKTFSI